MFDHVVGWASFEGFDGVFLADRAGDENERNIRGEAYGIVERRESVVGGEGVVAEDDIRLLLRQVLQETGPVVHIDDVAVDILGVEARPDEFDVAWIVFEIENAEWRFHDGTFPCCDESEKPSSERSGLVDHGPEQSQCLDGFDELLEIDGFNDVGIDTEIVAFDDITFFPRRCEHDDGEGAELLARAEFSQHLDAIHARHLDVQQHHGWGMVETSLVISAAEQVVERLFAVFDDEDLVGEMVLGERFDGEFDVTRTVFREKDASEEGLHARVLQLVYTSMLSRQGEVERGAFVDGAFRPDATLMPENDALHVGEADAGSFIILGRMKPLEHTEQLPGVAHVKAYTIVAD